MANYYSASMILKNKLIANVSEILRKQVSKIKKVNVSKDIMSYPYIPCKKAFNGNCLKSTPFRVMKSITAHCIRKLQ